jgi:NADH-quinone oxidoreductase subunit M
VNTYLLSLLLFSPLAGAVILLFLPKNNHRAIRSIALVTTFVTVALAVVLYVQFDGTVSGFQFVQKVVWIDTIDVAYHVGVDGISILLIMLTAILMPISVLASWESIAVRVKEYFVSMLLLEVGMLGVFIALDLFLFYVFWEAMLIPMYFIIGVWGGKERVYAAVKFFIFTMVGSLLMLVAIIWIGVYAGGVTGHFTTNLLILYEIAPTIPLALQGWMFLAFALSFLIKVPLFPLHTWLPDAHVEAPTAGSVILAGVLLKMGTYGLIRFCLPLFPAATYQYMPLISVLAVVGIIYGALVAMVQTDVKKLIAYSSVSHLGFIVLGIFALNEEALQGSIIHMINHGLSTGALFLLVGMIYDRRHTRMIADFGGIAKVMPVYATFFLIMSLSSIGLPGLNGFVGEFLILLGSFRSVALGTYWYAIVAASGVILAAVYMLWMYQRVMLGETDKEENTLLKDIDSREIATLIPIALFVVWIGIYPSAFLNKTQQSAQDLLEQVEQGRAAWRSTLSTVPADLSTPTSSGDEEKTAAR